MCFFKTQKEQLFYEKVNLYIIALSGCSAAW
jgi:hypothetical protein